MPIWPVNKIRSIVKQFALNLWVWAGAVGVPADVATTRPRFSRLFLPHISVLRVCSLCSPSPSLHAIWLEVGWGESRQHGSDREDHIAEGAVHRVGRHRSGDNCVHADHWWPPIPEGDSCAVSSLPLSADSGFPGWFFVGFHRPNCRIRTFSLDSMLSVLVYSFCVILHEYFFGKACLLEWNLYFPSFLSLLSLCGFIWKAFPGGWQQRWLISILSWCLSR